MTESDLGSRLLVSRLVSPEQLAKSRAALKNPNDDAQLLELLIQLGLLTKWQAAQVQAGRERGFFLEHYKLLDPLGAGGMGQVFRAQDTELDRQVAIKLLPKRLATCDAIERFRREGQAALQVQHEHIVRSFELGREGDTHFLVMELVEGTNLEKYVEKRGVLSAREAARIGYEVALALEHARQQGIIHRDIKPSNILLDPNGRAKLADLGLAKFFGTGENRPATITHTGAFMGTVDYCAPEQAEDAKRADTRSDIYSLGCTLYHCLTGHAPFPDGTAVQKIVAHREREPAPIHEWNAQVPQLLCSLILKRMLAKRPEERFQAPAEVAAGLRPWATGEPVASDQSLLGVLIEEERAADAAQLPSLTERNRVTEAVTRPSIAARPRPGPAFENRPRRVRHRRPAALLVPAGLAAAIILLLAWLLGPWHPKNEPDMQLLTRPAPEAPQSPAPRPGNLPLVNLPDQSPSFPAQSTGQDTNKHASTKGKVPEPASGPLAVAITNSIGMKVVLVPPGRFLMGAPDSDGEAGAGQKPQHPVRLSRPFYMGATEVTVGQFRMFVQATRYQTEAETAARGATGYNPVTRKMEYGSPKYTWKSMGWSQHDNHPVVNVSWNDAVAFCRWLSATEAATYRLPTEAEWEYACRAGTTTRFSSGNQHGDLAGVANIADLSLRQQLDETYQNAGFSSWDDRYPFTASVGCFKPNAFGLYDMHGNVWEWCADYLDENYYKTSPIEDPSGPSSGTHRISRGGSWWNVNANKLSSSYRDWGTPSERWETAGFRIVRVPAEE